MLLIANCIALALCTYINVVQEVPVIIIYDWMGFAILINFWNFLLSVFYEIEFISTASLAFRVYYGEFWRMYKL